MLGDNEKMNLSDVELIPLPLEPQVKIRGIIPETATLFKVSVMGETPCVVRAELPP